MMCFLSLGIFLSFSRPRSYPTLGFSFYIYIFWGTWRSPVTVQSPNILEPYMSISFFTILARLVFDRVASFFVTLVTLLLQLRIPLQFCYVGIIFLCHGGEVCHDQRPIFDFVVLL